MFEIKVVKPVVVVDYREDAVFDELLRSLGAVVKRKQLDVGDFLCSSRTVIERKRFEDFEASVIDGRIFKQAQMLSSFECAVVLVESPSLPPARLSEASLLGAYASLCTDYSLSLLFSRSPEETAKFVYAFAKHEQLSKRNPLRILPRKRALTPSQQQRAVVESFPLIGPRLARNLLLHFGSLRALFSASEREISSVEGVGKKRARIFFNLLNRVYDENEDSLR